MARSVGFAVCQVPKYEIHYIDKEVIKHQIEYMEKLVEVLGGENSPFASRQLPKFVEMICSRFRMWCTKSGSSRYHRLGICELFGFSTRNSLIPGLRWKGGSSSATCR